MGRGKKKERQKEEGWGGEEIFIGKDRGPRTVKRAEKEHSYLFKRAKFIDDTERATKQVQEEQESRDGMLLAAGRSCVAVGTRLKHAART